MSQISGKVAFITGAAKGLGKAFSDALLLRGAKVFMCDVDANLGLETCTEFKSKYGEGSCDFMHCDVTNKDQLENFFKTGKDKYSQVDIVCNNAGILHETEWEKMLQINLVGMIRGTQLGIEHMGKDRGGRGGVIINLSSAAGLTFVPFCPAYTATKHGIIGFSKSLALHPSYLKHQVRINCLCPFFADTDILKVKPEAVLDVELAKNATQAVGVVPVSDVTEGFLELVQNQSLHGDCLVITVRKKKLAQFPKTGFESLIEKNSNL